MTDDRTMLAMLKEAIRSAILTMSALGSSDARFLAFGSAWAGGADDPALAYGYGETTVRIQPTAQEISRAEIVSDWLSWLGARDATALARLNRWARGMPLWKIADLEHVSERTVLNRIDRSCAGILAEFLDIRVCIDPIAEPPRQDHVLSFAAPLSVPDEDPEELPPGRVYICGVGWMRRRRDERAWKRHRTGQYKIDQMQAVR